MSLTETVQRLTGYKAWADEITFEVVRSLPDGEATKERKTRYKNMVYTLNHVYVIDDIFKAHSQGKPHSYTARNTDICPALEDLWEAVQIIDQWYLDYAHSVSEQALQEIIQFRFVDGAEGIMSRSDMILHVVNHGTYHRGLVSDMMYQISVVPPTHDLTVYLSHVVYGSNL
ncbi:MAG: DinB family protein [Oculatellaceae cyanobacterium Prado106]|jgi:uncharacterized damage-inducible protein DinB|nr:DinB family protein [Oculatellaceae cyanobacterium Prado106]